MKRSITKLGADWCNPCKAVAPIVKKVCTELGITVNNVDVDMFPETAKEFNVMGIPTLLLMEDGKVVKRLTGNFSEQKLRDFLA